jgi:[NiFe] hydrogenase assembly HybE family chaperone
MTSVTSVPGLTRHRANPAQLLERIFRDIHATRMQGLPILNTALEVEAVGFRPWEGHWLGVLITPWFMNVMLLPGPQARWPDTAPGGKRDWELPSGVYSFIVGHEATLGGYHMCSLFSPVFEMPDPATARLTALAALEAMLRPEDYARNVETALPPGPVATVVDKLDQPMSKRDFLRGGVFRRDGS